MDKYKVLNKIGEGTFSEVVRCLVTDQAHPLCGTYCAMKRMKKAYPSLEHVNSIREVQALKRLNPHPNILKLVEVVYSERHKTLDLVCELLEMNMYDIIRDRKKPLPEARVKLYMYQLCKGLEHMHKHGIFHRDIKPENVLVNVETNVLKIADFGSCRGIYSRAPFTEYISTRWYRAPECLLTDGYYGYKMDTWSVGCVFYESFTLHPLFPGRNELDQLAQIHGVLGTPPTQVLNKIRKHSMHMKFSFASTPGNGLKMVMPGAGPVLLDLMEKFLAYDPNARISAKQAVRHPYFADIRESDKQAVANTTVTHTATTPTNKNTDGGNKPSNADIVVEQEAVANTVSGSQSNDKGRQAATDNQTSTQPTKAIRHRNADARSIAPDKATSSTHTGTKRSKPNYASVKSSGYGRNAIARKPSNSQLAGHKGKNADVTWGADRGASLPHISHRTQGQSSHHGDMMRRKHHGQKYSKYPHKMPGKGNMHGNRVQEYARHVPNSLKTSSSWQPGVKKQIFAPHSYATKAVPPKYNAQMPALPPIMLKQLPLQKHKSEDIAKARQYRRPDKNVN